MPAETNEREATPAEIESSLLESYRVQAEQQAISLDFYRRIRHAITTRAA